MNADEALRLIDDLIRTAGEKPLNDLQRSIFRGAWLGKNYKEIWQECSQVSLDHIMRNVGPNLWQLLSRVASEQVGEPIKVRKESLQGPIERVRDRLPAPQIIAPATPASDELVGLPDPSPNVFLPEPPDFAATFHGSPFDWQTQSINRAQNWGQAPAASQFQGRSQELSTLYQWIEEDACRLVTLTGSAGIGKTDLSVKLAERLRDRFEWVVWRSLDPAISGHEPPPLSDLLSDLLAFLTGTAPAASLTSFVDCLRNQRCLVVLDGFEAVLQSKVLSGDYLPGYENYSDLLKRVSDTQHLSCLIVTSREQPREIEAREGENVPVRGYPLLGLTPEEVQSMYFTKGSFIATEADWRSLTHQYDGNPRFLQQVATTITNAFGRDISRFLTYQQNKPIFVGEIRRSLDQQMARLSYPEVTLVQALAKHAEPASLEEIQGLMQTAMSSHHLLEVLLSLVRRSLLHSTAISYTLNPLLMDYLAQR
jgi:hypothetical protein